MNYPFSEFAANSGMEECFLGYMYFVDPLNINEQAIRVGVYSGDMMAARIRDSQNVSLDCAKAIVVMMEANHVRTRHSFRAIWASQEVMICVAKPDDDDSCSE